MTLSSCPRARCHRLSGDALVLQGLALSCELEHVTSGRFTHEPNRRLAKQISNQGIHWFWFLIDPTIQATNHWAEQAIRPAVVNRKVWGGNRTWLGAQAQGILMSVIRTCGQRAIDPFAFLINVLCRQLILP
jgi:transposase